MPFAAQLVELGEQRGGRHRLAIDGDGIAPLEADGDDGRLVRRFLRRERARVDVIRHLDGRILQHLPLGGGVEQVRVHRERALAALVLGDRDLVLLGEGDQLLAGAQVPFAPGGDDRDVGLEGVVAELEPDLIVPLAGGAVADGIRADALGDLDLLLGDERPGDGGAEQVDALVDRVRPEHREHVIADELLAEVLDVDVLRLDAEQFRLAAGGFQLLALAEIGGERHHLAAIGGLQPLQDDGGVEAARIGEHDLLHGGLGGIGHATSGNGRAWIAAAYRGRHPPATGMPS